MFSNDQLMLTWLRFSDMAIAKQLVTRSKRDQLYDTSVLLRCTNSAVVLGKLGTNMQKRRLPFWLIVDKSGNDLCI